MRILERPPWSITLALTITTLFLIGTTLAQAASAMDSEYIGLTEEEGPETYMSEMQAATGFKLNDVESNSLGPPIEPMVDSIIFSEDFEGVLSEDWTTNDTNTNSGLDYWNITSHKAHNSSSSAWCAEVGTNSVYGEQNNNDIYQYDNNMNASIYRTINLTGYISATLKYYYWLDSNSSDYLYVMYYDGSWNYTDPHTGDSGGWQNSSVEIPTTATSVGFFFESNTLGVLEGAYVDDIELIGTMDDITIVGKWVYLDNNSGEYEPIRYAYVELWDEDSGGGDDLLSSSITDKIGSYSLGPVGNYDDEDGSTQDVYVRIYANSTSARVKNDSSNIYNYTIDFGDNLSNGIHDFGTQPVEANDGAYFMMDVIIDEYQWLDNRTGWTRSQVDVIWPNGSVPYTNGDQIYIPSGDEWNRTMILNQYAHCIHFEARGGSFPTGTGPDPHYIDSESSGGFALTEGWAWFMQCAVDDDPSCVPGSPKYTLENTTYADSPFGHGDTDGWDGNIVEGAIAQIFWDLYDDSNTSDYPAWDDSYYGDNISNEFLKLWDIMLNDTPANIDSFWGKWSPKNADIWAIFYHARIEKDASPPENPDDYSSSHTVSDWSQEDTIWVEWSGATDDLSGIRGYSFEWDQEPATVPDTIVNTTGVNITSHQLNDADNWYLHVRACDRAGKWATGAYHIGPFFIDAGLPVNPDSNSSSHAPLVWSNDDTISVNWSGAFDDTSGIYGYSIEWDNNTFTIPDDVVDTTLTEITSAPLSSDDNWHLHVRAQDIAGNWANDAYHVGPFYIDGEAPTNPMSHSSSHQPSTWSSDNTIYINWSGATDYVSGVNGYSYKWDTYSSTIPDTTVDTTGTEVTSALLSSGNSWYLHVRARDAAGNWAYGAYHIGPFYIDTEGPTNPGSYGSSHTTLVWSSDDTIYVSWSGANDGHSGVYGYSYVWDKSSSTLPDMTIDTLDTSTTSTALSSGMGWHLHLRTRDVAGNWANGAYHIGPFHIDKTPPSLTIIAPLENSYLNGASVSVTWNGSDTLSGVDHYEVRINDGGWVDIGMATSCTFPSLLDSAHTVDVTVFDTAGNSALSSISFNVDSVNPTVMITFPSDNSQINITSLTVNWMGDDDNSGIDHYEVKLDNGAYISVGLDTSYTFTGLRDGTHMITIRIVDEAGNSGETSKEFMVDADVGASGIFGNGLLTYILLIALIAAIVISVSLAVMRRRRKKDAEDKLLAKERREASEMDKVLEKLEELKELMEDHSSREYEQQGAFSDDFIDTLERMESVERR